MEKVEPRALDIVPSVGTDPRSPALGNETLVPTSASATSVLTIDTSPERNARPFRPLPRETSSNFRSAGRSPRIFCHPHFDTPADTCRCTRTAHRAKADRSSEFSIQGSPRWPRYEAWRNPSAEFVPPLHLMPGSLQNRLFFIAGSTPMRKLMLPIQNPNNVEVGHKTSPAASAPVDP